MQVHLTPEQEARIAQVARRDGTYPEELVKAAALRVMNRRRYTAAELVQQQGEAPFPTKTAHGWMRRP